MLTGLRVFLTITALIMVSCMAGVVTAASIDTDWKERVPFEGSTYNGLMFSSDGSKIFAGGSQMYVRSWDRELHWGGRSGFIATMSTDGNYVAYGAVKSLVVLYKDGTENWTRNMDGEVTAVAISGDGTYVISADNKGNINTWDINGDLYARNTTDLIKQIAVSPLNTLVVTTTDTGLKFFTPALNPVWTDIKNGSLDNDIIFSNDGSTIITAGGKRVSSHTSTGKLNWMKEIPKEPITGIACSNDCSVIVIGSEDGIIQAVDRYGTVHWEYPAALRINSVGVSQDARVIAAAGVDRNLYILNNGGKLLTKELMDTIIHSQSIAVSGDGKHIVVADENNLKGFTLSLDSDNSGLITLIPTSTRYTETKTPLPTTEPTTIVTPVITEPVTTIPTPTQSPLSPAAAMIATVAGILLMLVKKKS